MSDHKSISRGKSPAAGEMLNIVVEIGLQVALRPVQLEDAEMCNGIYVMTNNALTTTKRYWLTGRAG